MGVHMYIQHNVFYCIRNYGTKLLEASDKLIHAHNSYNIICTLYLSIRTKMRISTEERILTKYQLPEKMKFTPSSSPGGSIVWMLKLLSTFTKP